MSINKSKFTLKRNDTLPALQVCIFERGRLSGKRGFSLSGVSAVTFSMVDTSCDHHKISLKPAQIFCMSGGTIQYNWDLEDTNEAGNYKGEFELFFIGGGKISLPAHGGIDIEIVKDINEG